MTHYLSTLNEREKWMVVITALGLFMYCYYLLLYAPLHSKVLQQTMQLQEKMETLTWMQQIKQQGLAIKTKRTVDNSQLLTLLAKQLKENILKFPYQIQQTSSGDIQLTFDAAPFNLVMRWLAQINKRYTVIIKQLEVQRSKTPGITKLMILIGTFSSPI